MACWSVMWKTVACVLLCSLFAKGHSSSDVFHAVTECCLTERAPRHGECKLYNCSSQPNGIYWQPVNATNGRYRATFFFPEGCHPHLYTATLRVVENATREQCTASQSFSRSQVHSFDKELAVNDYDGKNCTSCHERGELNFQFVYPGCYQLEITPKFRVQESVLNLALVQSYKTEKVITSCPEYLESDYRKQLINDGTQTPEALPQCTGDVVSLKINMAGQVWKETTLTPSMFTFSLRNETKRVSRWEAYINPDKTVKCISFSEREAHRLHCEIDSRGILTVGLSPVPLGIYSFDVEIDHTLDDRCRSATLWTQYVPSPRPCLWDFGNVICERDPQVLFEPAFRANADFPYNVIGGIFLACVLSAVAAYVAFRYFANKRRLAVPVVAQANGHVVGQRPAILLLYSRDCDAFMNAMVSFRQLLRTVLGCQVHDCHDPSQWTDVSLNPTGWMQRLATTHGIRVIVVASRCASLRQEALLAGDVVRFARPLNTDPLFTYGLQLVTDTAAMHAYRTTFVVRLGGFSDDKDLFKVLNSYTRYVLPSHLDTLLCGLQQEKTIGKSGEPWLDSKEVQNLLNDLDTLATYKSQNARYLEDMLVVQKAVYDFGIAMDVRA